MPERIQNASYFPQPSRGVFTLRDFFYVLFRHKWKITVFFLITMVAVIIGAFMAKEIYRSEAKVMVKIGRESVTLDPTAATGQVISAGPSRESEINSEIEILRSKELVLKVVDAIGPTTILGGTKSSLEIASPGRSSLQEFQNQLRLGFFGRMKKNLAELGLLHPVSEREEAITQFSKNFNVERQKDTNILALAYDGADAEVSQNILLKVIEVFLEKHIAAHRTSGSYEFFGKQTDQIRNQVAGLEEELRKLKSTSGVSSLEEQKRILITRIGTLQQESETTQSALAISRAKVQGLRGKLSNMSPTLVTTEVRGNPNQGADLMRSRLYELQLKELELLSKYTPQSRPVQEVRKQIEDAKALLAQEEPTRTQVTTGINPAYQELNLELIKETTNFSSLEAKANVLKAQQEKARSELAELNNTEVKMGSLQRELALLDGKYKKYAENLEQARIDQALMNNKISNISVVQAPTASLEPFKPLRAIYIALGFLVGILGGILLAFFSESYDHSLRKPQDVEEKLNMPLLASIPVLKK